MILSRNAFASRSGGGSPRTAPGVHRILARQRAGVLHTAAMRAVRRRCQRSRQPAAAAAAAAALSPIATSSTVSGDFWSLPPRALVPQLMKGASRQYISVIQWCSTGQRSHRTYMLHVVPQGRPHARERLDRGAAVPRRLCCGDRCRCGGIHRVAGAAHGLPSARQGAAGRSLTILPHTARSSLLSALPCSF